MDQKTIIKWALIAAAAYVVYRFVLKDGLLDKLLGGGVTPTPQPTTPGQQPTTPITYQPAQPAQPAQPPAPPGMKDRVAAAAAAAGYAAGSKLTADQWGYFYNPLSAVPQPDPLLVWPGRDRSTPMTIDEWWSGISAYGLSGLGGLGAGFRDLSRMVAVNPWIT